MLIASEYGVLLKQLAMCNAKEKEDDCELLSELTGIKILKRLSKKYNKDYYVKKEDIDVKILTYSDYKYGFATNHIYSCRNREALDEVLLHDEFVHDKNNSATHWKMNPYYKLAKPVVYDGSGEE